MTAEAETAKSNEDVEVPAWGWVLVIAFAFSGLVLAGVAGDPAPSATADQQTAQVDNIANRLAACHSAEDELGGYLRMAASPGSPDWLAGLVEGIDPQPCDDFAPSFRKAVDEAASSLRLASDQGKDRAIEAMQMAKNYLDAAVQETSKAVPYS